MRIILFFLFWLINSFTFLYGQKFTNVTQLAGLDKLFHSNGIAVADYDLDGDLDIYIVGAFKYDSNKEETWNRLLSSNGDGTFTDVTLPANVLGETISPHEIYEGAKFGAAWGDFDNDNDPDLFVTNYGYNLLYKNNGDGTFSDISELAGIKGPVNDINTSACWWDFDLDGDLDLYVSSYVGRNLIYENIGNDKFNNVTVETGLGDRGNTWTSIPFDANNDNLPDIYLANDFGQNVFYLNQGDGTFKNYTKEFGLEDSGNGMGLGLGDYNNDGFFDLYVTNISSVRPCPLFENQGNGNFIDMANQAGVSNSGWAWGNEFFDYDNDGDLDLYVVNGHIEESGNNYLFSNQIENDRIPFEERGSFFINILDSSGINSSEEARALVTFDYDEDGDLDLLVGNFWTNPYLFENISETKNWIKIWLKGTVSNRNAFGATVSISCGEKKIYRSNDGIDFLGQSILPLHFGIGKNEIIDSITVKWPTGEYETIKEVNINQTITVVENEGLVLDIKNQADINLNTEFYLIGNYPNPFNSTTNIIYNAPNNGIGKFIIFDFLGQSIYKKDILINRGQNQIQWQGIDRAGNSIPSGLYFYFIENENNRFLFGKLILMK